MKSITRISLTIAAMLIVCCAARFARAGSSDEAEIKALEARFVKALEAKDVDAIMANYVPGDSLLVFDLLPPRQYVGSDAYKKDWQGFLASCQGPLKVEMTDVSVVADGQLGYGHNIERLRKLGYGHNIQRLRCATANGTAMDITTRVTDGYQKHGGKWLIVHEHVSVPVDLATGKPDLNSKP